MKKYILLIGAIVSIGIQAFAAKYGVYMEYHKLGQGTQSTTVRRTPVQTPVDVFYNEETHQIEVVCESEALTAQVYLCDENGNTLAYSPCINSVLDIPASYSGLLLIRIVGDDWYGQATVAV